MKPSFMKYRRITRMFTVMLFVTIFVAGFGNAVLHLWNALMPVIFGLPLIGFWQAVGLLSLSWLLFGGPRGLMSGRRLARGYAGMHPGMTSEEREKLREVFETRYRRCH